MITVTASAGERIRNDLQAINTEPGVCLRLFRSQSTANQLDMALDTEREGDQVVESKGIKIFLLDPEMSRVLERTIIDYDAMPEGNGFSITNEFQAGDLATVQFNPVG
jgi:Fe-S cluster assembly iron-binding protein IscA